MNEIFLLYLFTRVDSLKALIIFAATLCAVIAVLSFAESVSPFRETDEKKAFCKTLKAFAICTIALTLLFTLTPSQKDLAIIFGGKFALDVAQSKEGTDTGKKVYQLMNKILDEQLEEKEVKEKGETAK